MAKTTASNGKTILAFMLVAALAGCASTTKYPGEIEEVSDPDLDARAKIASQWNAATEMFAAAAEAKPGSEEMEKVIIAYEKIFEMDPRFAPAYKQIGLICEFYLNDPERARKYYEQYSNLAADAAEKDVVNFLKEGPGDSKPEKNGSPEGGE